jgi:uncharacterized protein YukE
VADQFAVTPRELRETSGHLNEVSTRMKEVLSVLGGNLAAEGAAWGDDKIGDQFAGGGGGYVAQQDWVEGSVGAKTNLLDYYSRALKGAADCFERQDGS